MSKLGKVWLYLIFFLAFILGGLIIYFYGYDYGVGVADENFTIDSTLLQEKANNSGNVWKHGITWFEIPVEDMERAKVFYEKLLDTQLEVMRDSLQNHEMIFLPPYGEGIITGSLVKSKNFSPSNSGVLVYLNCNPDLNEHLSRAKKAGSEIIQPKSLINEEIGYIAIITDSEGNRIALHSSN